MVKTDRQHIIVGVIFAIAIMVVIYFGGSIIYTLGKAIIDRPVTEIDKEREKLYLKYADDITALQQQFKQMADEIDREFREKIRDLDEKEKQEKK